MLKIFFLAFLLPTILDIGLLGRPVSPLDLFLVFLHQLNIHHVILLSVWVLGVDEGVGLYLGGLGLLLGTAAKVKHHLYELIKIQYYYINGLVNNE